MIEYLLCASHCSKYFTGNKSLHVKVRLSRLERVGYGNSPEWKCLDGS